MLLRSRVLATALIGSSSVQSSTSAAVTSTSSAAAATHTVAVGADGFNFTPNQLHANVGDIIEYRFYPQNHSVARAAFTQPCIPYEDTGPNRVGFWSGFQPVALVLSNPPIFRLPINDTEPVFFYCSAPGACFEGMVGVINPNATWTFSAQFNYSQNATEEFSPLEYFPKETLNPTRGTTAVGATSSSTSTVSTSPAANSSSKKDLSTGGIVGITIGCLAVFGLAGLLIYIRRRQKKTGEILRNSEVPLQAGRSSNVAPKSGISEANYPNIQKADFVARDIDDLGGNGRFNAQDAYRPVRAETESHRSMSPAIDEWAMVQPLRNLWDLRNGKPNKETSSWQTANSPGSPSPMYTETHGMENGNGLRLYNPDESPGPHEMPVTSPNVATPPASARPFSFTDSESGYKKDEKSGRTL